MEFLNKGVERLRKQIDEGLIEIGSKTKVEINVVEGNRYYNLKNTGIGFHGDTERVVVICISIGCDNYPMRWQWFKDGMPVGKSIDVTLNCGDVYIMSEKAVGADWKLKSKYTLRHSAGAAKYRSLSKWEKKRPLYEARIKERAEKKALKEKEKEAKQKAKLEKNDKGNKGKTTIGCKKIMRFRTCEKKYKSALRKHDWNDNNGSFYRWVAIEAEHEGSPDCEFYKEFRDIWSGKAEDYTQKMDTDVWEKHRNFYRNLCAYGVYF